MFYIRSLKLVFVHGQKTAGSSIATCISNLTKKDVITTPFGRMGSKFYFGSSYIKFEIKFRYILFYWCIFFADIVAFFFPRLRKKRSNGFGGFLSFITLTSLNRHSSYIDFRKWAGAEGPEVKNILFVYRNFEESFSSYVQYIYKSGEIDFSKISNILDDFIFAQKQMMTWPDHISIFVLRFDSISESYASFARFANETYGTGLNNSLPHINNNNSKTMEILDFDIETKNKIREAGEWADRVLQSHPNVIWF